MIGLARTDSVPRRTVHVNAMMANSILLAALVAVPILSTIHVRSRPKSRLGENSERTKKLLLDLSTRCIFVGSAAIFLSPNVHRGQRWDSEPGFHRSVEHIVPGF